MGATHGDAETYPRLADVVGFLQARAVARRGRGRAHHAARLRQPRRAQARPPQVHDRGPRPRVVRRRDHASAGFRARAGAPVQVRDHRRPLRLDRRVRRPLAPDAAHRSRPRRRYGQGTVAHGPARDRQGAPRRFPPDAEPEPDDRQRGRERARVHRRRWSCVTASTARAGHARCARRARVRRAADLRAGDGRGRALPAAALAAGRRTSRRERPGRCAAGAAHHRLPERLRATVPRGGRAGRQGARALQPVLRRRRQGPAPQRAAPRERRRAHDRRGTRRCVRALRQGTHGGRSASAISPGARAWSGRRRHEPRRSGTHESARVGSGPGNARAGRHGRGERRPRAHERRGARALGRGEPAGRACAVVELRRAGGRVAAHGDARVAVAPGRADRYGLPVPRDVPFHRRPGRAARTQPQGLPAARFAGLARGASRPALGAGRRRHRPLQRSCARPSRCSARCASSA